MKKSFMETLIDHKGLVSSLAGLVVSGGVAMLLSKKELNAAALQDLGAETEEKFEDEIEEEDAEEEKTEP